MKEINGGKIWHKVKQQGNARAGWLVTAHGKVPTPCFMPVGTQATVKALDPIDIEKTGAAIILANTYHLYLRPGAKIIESFKGLHEFMGWKHPILTDSGGYQVSSLGSFRDEGEVRLTEVTEEGVKFVSHLDGSKHFLTPALAMEIQAQLGADIIMAFDEATPDRGLSYAKQAMKRTHTWLKRCVTAWQKEETKKQLNKEAYAQYLFGIIQGGNYPKLRRESADLVLESGVAGLALGGASIGKSVQETTENASWVIDQLQASGKPVYFMGVGVSPSHAIGAVLAGADMFDCVAPTKLARCGLLYQGKLRLKQGHLEQAWFDSEYTTERLNIEKREFARDQRPIDEACDCATCSYGYSRAYLHHLFKARELLYYRLGTIHNIRVMVRTVQELRKAILES